MLPDLIIEPPSDPSTWTTVDDRLGIVTFAYTIDNLSPKLYFIWDRQGDVRKVGSFDRAGFSNRCRDRGSIDFFRDRLNLAKRRYGVYRPMRIVGLVPADVDRRFADAQVQAAQQAGLRPDEIAETYARYDPQTRWGVVITSVVQKQDRSRPAEY